MCSTTRSSIEWGPVGILHSRHISPKPQGFSARSDLVHGKNPAGGADLYSLHDMRGVREDESFEKGDLRGRYRAIPFFGQFDFPLVSEETTEAPENLGRSGS